MDNIIDKRTKGEWKVRQISSDMLEIVTTSFNYSGTGICVLDADNDQSEANAAFIVKACNEYDELVKLKELAIKELHWFADHDNKLQEKNDSLVEQNKELKYVLNRAMLLSLTPLATKTPQGWNEKLCKEIFEQAKEAIKKATI